MKSRAPIALLLIILCLLLSTPAAAQSNTAEPAATDLITLEVAATTEAGAPIYALPAPTEAAAPLTPVTPPAEPSGTTQFVIGGLTLVVVVLLVSVLALVFMTLRSRAAHGSEQAAQWLRMLEATRDTFVPREQTRARIATWEKEAEASPGLADDVMVWMIKQGYQIIAPTPSAAASQTTVNVGSPAQTTGPSVSATRVLTDLRDDNWPGPSKPAN